MGGIGFDVGVFKKNCSMEVGQGKSWFYILNLVILNFLKFFSMQETVSYMF